MIVMIHTEFYIFTQYSYATLTKKTERLKKSPLFSHNNLIPKSTYCIGFFISNFQ